MCSSDLDAREAAFRVRLGDLDRARELLDDAERGPHGGAMISADHVRTLIGSVRTSLRLESGDPAGAAEALEKTYASALKAQDLPLLSLVAVNAAALADAHGEHHEAAVLLGAASRLRGAHDRTDRQIGELTRRGRAALGDDVFAAAYAKGWELDGKTATTAVDPTGRRADRKPDADRGRGGV